MLLVNDILSYSSPEGSSEQRVLWIHPALTIAYLIDIHVAAAMPVLREYPVLLADLAEHRAQLLAEDPYHSQMMVPRSDKQKAVRDKAWQMIQPLVEHAPAIFDPQKRGRLIRSLLNQGTARSMAICVAIGSVAKPPMRYCPTI